MRHRDNVLPNQINSGVSDRWRVILQVVINCTADVALTEWGASATAAGLILTATNITKYCRIFQDDLSQRPESLCSHENSGCVKAIDNNVQRGLECILQHL